MTLLVIPNFDLFRILSDVAVDRLFDEVALAACDPEDEVIQRGAAQDVHMVAFITLVSIG